MSFTGDSNLVRQSELEEVTLTSTKKSLPIGSNILNRYRSYTYNFTIAAWPKDLIIEEGNFNLNLFKNIILTSKGKGQMSKFEGGFDRSEEVETFNANSPGRYDLYIDGVEMETIPTPSSKNGNTIATRLEFDVFEPFSVVGFLESLRAAAASAGYRNYLEASYLFLIQYKGYNDKADFPNPENIPVDRYFKIKFLDIDVNVDLSGTKYKCSALPFNEFAFSNVIGSIKYSMQMSGEKVKDIADDLIKKLNENILAEAKKLDPTISNELVDRYMVQFGEDPNQINDIGKASVKELSVNNTIYQFEDLSKTTKRTAYQQEGNPTEFVLYEPDKIAVTFYEGAFLQEIFSSLARDSTFWTDQIDPKSGKTKKDFFKFWRIVPEVTVGDFSPFHKREVYIILYKVLEQDMHISMMPGNSSNSYDPRDIEILRRYDYIYTGKNTEILNLKINFNKLFYERISVALGNNDRSISQNSDKRAGTDNNTADSTTISSKLAGPSAHPGGVPTLETDKRTIVPASGAGNAINPTSAKSYLAKDYYDVLLSDTVSMIEVDLEIIGDPVWVAQYDGTLSTAIPKQSPYAYFIKLYFRNPVDVDENDINESGTGLLKFSNTNIRFSGIYMVKQIVSTFKGGVFKQTLRLIRMSFVETEDDSSNELIINSSYSTKPNEDDQGQPSTNQPIPLDKRSSLKNLVSGVNRFADSLQNAEARITGAIQGAVGEITGAVSEVVAMPSQAIARVTNSIQGKLQGINDIAVNAADKLNLTPSQLGSLSAKELLTVVAISKLLPDNVNFGQLEENGIMLPNKDALKKVPPPENKNNESNTEPLTVSEIQKGYEKVNDSFPTDLSDILKNTLQG